MNWRMIRSLIIVTKKTGALVMLGVVLGIGCGETTEPGDEEQQEHELTVWNLGVDPPQDENIEGMKRCDDAEECFGSDGATQWNDFVSIFGESAAHMLNQHLYHLVSDPNAANSTWIHDRRAAQDLAPLGPVDAVSEDEAKKGVEFVLSEIVDQWPKVFGISPEHVVDTLVFNNVHYNNGLLRVDARQEVEGMSVGHSSTRMRFDENWMLVSVSSWLQPVDDIDAWLAEIDEFPDKSDAKEVLNEALSEELENYNPSMIFEFEPVWMPQYQSGGYSAGVSTDRYPNGEYFFVTLTNEDKSTE